jgi:hypothetical protein
MQLVLATLHIYKHFNASPGDLPTELSHLKLFLTVSFTSYAYSSIPLSYVLILFVCQLL